MTAVSVLVALTVFVSGAFYFRRMEQNFADVL
jgi:ABC-type polysaccharide/polyol phosphate export permease